MENNAQWYLVPVRQEVVEEALLRIKATSEEDARDQADDAMHNGLGETDTCHTVEGWQFCEAGPDDQQWVHACRLDEDQADPDHSAAGPPPPPQEE